MVPVMDRLVMHSNFDAFENYMEWIRKMLSMPLLWPIPLNLSGNNPDVISNVTCPYYSSAYCGESV